MTLAVFGICAVHCQVFDKMGLHSMARYAEASNELITRVALNGGGND